MTLRREISALLRLAWPVVAAQVGMMTFALVDTEMVGALGKRELAAVALADVILFGSLILGMGFVMGIDPIVSQAHGAKDEERAGRGLLHGILLAVIAAVPLTVIWFNVGPLMLLVGLKPELARLGQLYTDAQVWSIAPFLVFTALRQYLQGRTRVVLPLLVILGANVFNYVANDALIFGRFGFPALGVYGAGLATGLTRSAMALALGVLVLHQSRRGHPLPRWNRAALQGWTQAVRYGFPVAVQLGLEVWAFSATTVFAGWLGEDATAAHVIVMRLASLAFMVPLGVSIAASTRVGNLLGASDPPGAQRAAWVALGTGLCFMFVSASAFILVPGPMTRIFSVDPAVVALAATIFPIAAAWQLFDGAQVVCCGILRGMGNTKPAAVANLLGYYGIGLPLGYALAFAGGLGVAGLWWGMNAGLLAISAGLVAIVAWRGPARVRVAAGA